MFLNSFWDLSGSWSGGSASPILSSKNTFQHKLQVADYVDIFQLLQWFEESCGVLFSDAKNLKNHMSKE